MDPLAPLVRASMDTYLQTLSPIPATYKNVLLSELLVSKLDFTLCNAWAAPTLQQYHSSVLQFLVFCDHHNVPPALHLPAPEILLCTFACHLAGQISGSTIRNQLSALKAWHIINNLPWNGATHLKYTLKGAENLTPPSSMHPS
jgi:hypothetical protein